MNRTKFRQEDRADSYPTDADTDRETSETKAKPKHVVDSQNAIYITTSRPRQISLSVLLLHVLINVCRSGRFNKYDAYHGKPLTSESGPDVSFASLLKGESKRKDLNFRTLITQAGNEADVAVLLESIRAVSASSMDGLDSMLENGPWFIRNNPLILKKWNLDVNLMKEDVVNVLVWV
ncbi:zinc finger, CCHC-type containing protein [Tanacetum coccineum]